MSDAIVFEDWALTVCFVNCSTLILSGRFNSFTEKKITSAGMCGGASRTSRASDRIRMEGLWVVSTVTSYCFDPF